MLHLSLVNPPLDASLDQTDGALFSAALLLTGDKRQASDGTSNSNLAVKSSSRQSQNKTLLLGNGRSR